MNAAPDHECPILARRRRFGLVLLGGALLTLCLGYAFWVGGEKGAQAEQLMAEMRERGERFTIAELFPEGFGDASTNRSADLYRLIDLLDEKPLQFVGQSKRELGGGSARPFWREATPHSLDSPGTNDWADLGASVDADADTLAEIYRLLPFPDRDLGQTMRLGMDVRPDRVRKRSLALQLSGVAAIELNRGNPSAAAAAMDGFTQLLHWHSRHLDLVSCIFGGSMFEMVIEAQWAVIQHTGWSDLQLSRWQQAWETNHVAPTLMTAVRVQRAFALEAFEMARTNHVRWLSMFGSRENLTEAFRQSFLVDRDKMFTLRFHQTGLDALRDGWEERSWPVFRSAYGSIRALDAELNRGFGSYCRMTHMFRFDVDKSARFLFQIETRREMLVAAIALRRFHLAKGFFPKQLNELAPEYLTREPRDWMNGGPLHYQRGINGWFELRSFGENGRDDLGGGDDLPWWQTPEQRGSAGP